MLSLLRTEKPNFDFWTHGQMRSKLWLCAVLEDLLKGQSKKPVVWILAGWRGVLAHLMLVRNEHLYEKVRSFDSDRASSEFADLLNNCWECADWKFKAITMDCNSKSFKEALSTEQPDVVVNTAAEHFFSDSWYESVKSGKIVIIQGSNLVHDNEEVRPVTSTRDLIARFPMSKILFEDQIDFEYPNKKFSRFMIAGHK